METIIQNLITKELSSDTEEKINILKKVRSTDKFIRWGKLTKELIQLNQANTTIQIPPKFYATLLQAFYPKLLEEKQMIPLIQKTINMYLSSEALRMLSHRFGLKSKDIFQKISAKQLLPWLGLWSSIKYPNLSRALFKSSLRAKYSGFKKIDLQKLIMYSPLFVLFRFGNMMESSNNVIWTRWIAEGKNLRHALHLPFPLTKRMAHWVTQAPHYLTFKEALLYGQLKALGGEDGLFSLCRQSRLYQNWNPQFREQFIRLIVSENVELYQHNFQTLVGYLDHRYKEEFNFQLNGRKLSKLMEQMNTWYRELEDRRYFNNNIPPILPKVNINPFKLKTGKVFFEIVQIVERQHLYEEGAAMHHCVYSYAEDCVNEKCSIWSFRKFHSEGIERLVTIELSAEKEICQARKKYNAMPTEDEVKMIRQWAIKEELTINEF